MPYHIEKEDNKYCVVNSDTDENKGCSDSKDQALAHMRALYAAEEDAAAKARMEEIIAEAPRIDPDTYSSNSSELASVLDAPEVPPVIEAQSGLTYGPDEKPWSGPIVFENRMTGDGRTFKYGSIKWLESSLPLAFRWQKSSLPAHQTAVQVGRVDSIERIGDVVFANGVIFTGDDAPVEGKEYFNLLKKGAAGGVSIDGDDQLYEVVEPVLAEDGVTVLQGGQLHFDSLRIRGLTAVDIPAFIDAKIVLSNTECDGNVLTAAAIPVFPPTSWFPREPFLEEPTPITVTADGRVFGHLALFDSCHIGFNGECITPPRGNSYAYFHTGSLLTAETTEVSVGHLTFDTGHADMYASAMSAASHYDNTGTVAADVCAGEDKFGIWVAGALRSTLSDEQIREFRSAPLSGDWRRIGGRLELVAALAVNTPGFPVPRVKVLVAGGNEVTYLNSYTNTVVLSAEDSEVLETKLARKNQLAREVYGDIEEYSLVASASNLPLASQDRAWNGPGAAGRMFDAASDADGNINKSTASRGFFKVAGDGSKRGDYSLPFADIIGGTLTAVPRGIFAAAGALQGSRGVTIEGADSIKPKVAAYYHRLQLKAPWESE